MGGGLGVSSQKGMDAPRRKVRDAWFRRQIVASGRRNTAWRAAVTGRRAGHSFGSDVQCLHRGGVAATVGKGLAIGSERLADDLVHIVVAIGGQPADERHVGLGDSERLVALEQLLIL